MNKTMEKILLSAVRSPSGDNAQPWLFEVSPFKIDLLLRPERDASLYNYQQRAARLALGAVIESIDIAAREYGLKANISLFPNNKKPNLTATIDLVEEDVEKSPLFDAIDKRVTNRGRYYDSQINDWQINVIFDSLKNMPKSSIYMTNKRADIGRLAKVAAINDKLIFENFYLHEFLFKQIRWNNKEVVGSSDGLDISTFELNYLNSLGFRLMSYWPLVNFLQKFGLPTIIGKKSEKTYLASSGFGLISVAENNDESLIWGGRAMQRVWLSATMAGLSFQPIAGIICLIQRINNGGENPLSLKQVAALREIEKFLKELWSIGDETMVMFFRIGQGAPPRARSLRLPLDKIVEEKIL